MCDGESMCVAWQTLIYMHVRVFERMGGWVQLYLGVHIHVFMASVTESWREMG